MPYSLDDVRGLLARDEISWKAKALYLFMAQFPDNQPPTAAQVRAASKDGKDSVGSAMRELRRLGLVRVGAVQDMANGMLAGTRWIIEPVPTCWRLEVSA